MKNIVVGTVVSLKFPVFSGSFSRRQFVRDAEIKRAVCVQDSYGSGGKHWFTFEILESDDFEYVAGKRKRFQGKNAYQFTNIISQPADIEEKTRDKNERKVVDSYFKA